MIIDTSDAKRNHYECKRLLKRTTSQMAAASQSNRFQAHNPHELKDLDYDDEEFHMSEASEEGTAVDYDS